MTPRDEEKLYWGDLHCHCGVSYGTGSLESALRQAREHLDFCSVVGHAAWHDMPTDRQKYAWIIDVHTKGFARCAENWPRMRAAIAEHDDPGRFVPILGYEWHSTRFGDHNVLYPAGEGDIIREDSLDAMWAHVRLRDGLAIPHHPAYPPGMRGVDWDAFDPERSPFVEIYSQHGCGESDTGPYPLYHDMGPRAYRSTAEAAYRGGLRFGLVGGTDNHDGFAGSHGMGLMGVYARELTREALWEAFKARRVFAVTGDRIGVDFSVNDVPMGGVAEPASSRRIRVAIEAADFIDHVELLANERVLRRWNGPEEADCEGPGTWHGKLRVEWGWARRVPKECRARLTLDGGRILDVVPLFAGKRGVMPHEDDSHSLAESAPTDRILEQTDAQVAWMSTTVPNDTPRSPNTSALVLEVEADPGARIDLEMNSLRVRHALTDLREGSDGHCVDGLLTMATRLHRAVPRSAYLLEAELTDKAKPGGECDCYRFRVAQRNGQWAWSSPVWVAG